MSDTRQVLEHPEALAAWADAHRAAGRTVALVPTMGFLHAGHLALIHQARDLADVVVTSVFVNPTQFGPDEDFDRYPRDTEGDLRKAFEAGTDAVYLPTPALMYPAGHSTRVQVIGITGPLCGAARPGHFDGVTTVVLKLFLQSRCTHAVFGEKDYQQLATIRRMVADLDVPVQVVSHPIVREPDGLAMSSRNAHLKGDARTRALCLSEGLAAAETLWAHGERDPRRLEAAARTIIEDTAGTRIDYVEVRDAFALDALEGPARAPVVLAMAVFLEGVRPTDNRVLGCAT